MNRVGVLVLLLVGFWACGVSAVRAATYTDPVPYCRAVKTIDQPDKRYVGPEVPDWIYRAMHHAKGDPGYVAWRCLHGQVLACENGGITGPCDRKDVNRHPTSAMRDFCRSHPGYDGLPAAITGHQTVFAWTCIGPDPRAGRQFMHPDKRGFAPDEWRRVSN